MFYIYVLRSHKDGRLYIGSTGNLNIRLIYHNSGKVKSTKDRRPFDLVYQEEFENKTEARKRELFLKSGKGRQYLNGVLDSKIGEGTARPPEAGPPPAEKSLVRQNVGGPRGSNPSLSEAVSL